MDVTQKNVCKTYHVTKYILYKTTNDSRNASEYNYNAIILIIQIQFRECNNKKYFEVLTFAM